MSKPRERWWGYVKNMIRAYPALKQQYDALHTQTVTADLSGLPRGGGAARTTEMIALRQLPPGDQRDYEAITKAIEITRQMPNGNTILKIIDLVYWKGRCDLDGAAEAVHVAEITAKRYHGDFIRLVWRCYRKIN